jgi:hypothetical protein
MTDSANVRFFEFDILASDNSGVYFDNCHQLGHILNNTNELMYPFIGIGEFKSFTSDLFLGADDVINYNQNHVYNGCNYSPMVFGNPYCSTNSINENNINSEFNIYPNPFKNEFIIEYNGQSISQAEIIIYNIVGEIIYQSTISNQRVTTVSLENLSEETYIVAIRSNNKITTKKLIKTE